MSKSRTELCAAFWQHVPESIEGYSGRINLLLDLLSDEQLVHACEIVGALDDETDEHTQGEHNGPS